jgi:16S rRNA G966 N2-methylase RsmD
LHPTRLTVEHQPHSPALIAFINEHLTDDLSRLRLSAHRWPDIPVAYAAAQIEAFQKLKTKLPDWYRTDLVMPTPLSVEQSSSAVTAQFKAGLIAGDHMADLTGGMGIDSFYFSHRVQQLDYVEQQAALVEAAKHNFSVLGCTNIHCHHDEATHFLSKINTQYDYLYLDPARRDITQKKVFQLIDCEPNVVQLHDPLLEKSKYVLIKAAPMLDLSQAVAQLPNTMQIWVVAVHNEVKELLFLLGQSPLTAPIKINAVNLQSNQPVFMSEWACEQQSASSFGNPLRYLYEPNAAVMKLGAFKTFGQIYGLHKLHPNSHLYTSEQLLAEVPARVFEVQAVVKYDKKAVRGVLNTPKANISVRNFPDSAAEVRTKLQLNDGGDQYLFATTFFGGEHRIVVTRKMNS